MPRRILALSIAAVLLGSTAFAQNQPNPLMAGQWPAPRLQLRPKNNPDPSLNGWSQPWSEPEKADL